jgi:hypothetical protein
MTKTRTRVVLASLLAWLAGADLAAAQAGAATPDAAARSFFAALESGRWMDAARMVHPDALTRFREDKLTSVRSALDPASRCDLTVDELLRHDPKMPRAVAEYQVQQASQNTRTHLRYELETAGVASLEEFERLGPEEAFARFLAANDERRQLQRALQGRADSVTGALISRMAPRTVRTLIGSVPAAQDAETAYAVYSVSHGGGRMGLGGHGRVSVVALRRDGAAWKLDPGEAMGHELFGGGSFAVSIEPNGSMPDFAALAARPAVWPETGTPRLRVRMEGAGADPLKQPPKTLILERLAANGTVSARVDVPAEAWRTLSSMFEMFMLMIPEPETPAP